jgi:hypothetical protein
MMVSIQESVSGLNYHFLQNFACFDCVVINHQKWIDCSEHDRHSHLFKNDFGDSCQHGQWD